MFSANQTADIVVCILLPVKQPYAADVENLGGENSFICKG